MVMVGQIMADIMSAAECKDIPCIKQIALIGTCIKVNTERYLQMMIYQKLLKNGLRKAMLRKEAKEVVCKYCNKVFKTRKAKEFFALIIVDMKVKKNIYGKRQKSIIKN